MISFNYEARYLHHTQKGQRPLGAGTGGRENRRQRERIPRRAHRPGTHRGRTDGAAVRSVVGTIDLPDDDALGDADAYVRAAFDRSLSRPMLVRETPPRRPRRG